MPTYMLIGIPVIVAILLWMILSLPDEELPTDKNLSEGSDTKAEKAEKKSKVTKKKK
ncbi:hypothetical protein HY408_00210 [Candidatus Gottesmanbacteria bacterium]|nr:hypothetical protein [Candidatus Gottesmanbacteria bacterium]